MHIENAQDNVEPSSANDSIKKNLNKKKKNNGEKDVSSSKKGQKKSRSNEKTAPRTPKFTYYTRLMESREYTPMATRN
ncbi:hypothetical protein PanWU01x14_105170, partial [Parasponia andersonii]